MTVPAVAEPRALATRLVSLQISEPALLAMLRLPGRISLLGAEAELWSGPRLILHLEMPGVPAGATEVLPEYERNLGGEPVRLTGLRWLHDGDEIGRTAVDGEPDAT